MSETTQKPFIIIDGSVTTEVTPEQLAAMIPETAAVVLLRNDVDSPRRGVVLHPIKSSNIRSVGYDIAIGELFIAFNSGVYTYANVNQQRYLGLLNAESAGKFLASDIKPNHEATKLG